MHRLKDSQLRIPLGKPVKFRGQCHHGLIIDGNNFCNFRLDAAIDSEQSYLPRCAPERIAETLLGAFMDARLARNRSVWRCSKRLPAQKSGRFTVRRSP